MANLYTQADSNIRKTWLLMTGFLLFIIFFGWLLDAYFENQGFLIVAVVFSFLTSFFSYWFSDRIVLSMTRARLIKREDDPELYRLVENLCLVAGLPLPRIYILEESQANAFATGRNKNHAVIALTRGLLEKLERAELEGVIAHELSHIGNKDMLLQTIVVTLAGVIAMLSDFFLRISFSGSGKRRDSGGLIVVIGGLIAAILAPIAATLIKLGISRKREFLADASGALLTRYPEGLARALEKISNDPHPLKVANSSTNHLYIASPLRGKENVSWFNKLFMTHPPVEERIKALREIKN